MEIHKPKDVSPVYDQELMDFSCKEVLALIQELDTCPLKNAGGRVVMPVGNGSSKIMLVGEAPGAKEDQLGEPFVGASGKFLNQVLLPAVGLDRERIYLTNIVKCRPPENRDPSEEEKTAWTPVLLAEIACYKPNLVVCLGRHSLGFFLSRHWPDFKISQVHGQVFEVPLFRDYTQKVLACYHPAVALYQASMREILIRDFGLIASYLA